MTELWATSRRNKLVYVDRRNMHAALIHDMKGPLEITSLEKMNEISLF